MANRPKPSARPDNALKLKSTSAYGSEAMSVFLCLKSNSIGHLCMKSLVKSGGYEITYLPFYFYFFTAVYVYSQLHPFFLWRKKYAFFLIVPPQVQFDISHLNHSLYMSLAF